MLNPYIDEPENPLERCYQQRYENEDKCRAYGFVALDCEKDLKDRFYCCVNNVFYKNN